MRLLYCFIVNKASGNGRAYKIWNKIEKMLVEREIAYCVYFTQKPKHATLLVRELIRKEEVKVIVAVGGDGTVHEVINGLIGSDVPFGIIPAGSGNDFSKGLGISSKYEKALERILNGRPKHIDIGCVNSTYFVTVAGIGFDGEVAHVANTSIYKKVFNYFRLGHITYLMSAIKVLTQYRPMDISIRIDKDLHTFKKVWLIAVANLPFYGGGLIICPKAKNNDGVFDICIVQGISKLEFLRLFPSVFKGKHIDSPLIKTYRGKELEIHSTMPLKIHGDGEQIGKCPAHIKIIPFALNVL
ncbi:diacylglycerol kinase family protein [Sutcliffiella horikoshii]|uniref:diacylglycerol/lipid kinase family protein n=1 Tax=Sutcliffiella horikoshii TaxID=79883 RepID=UPI002F2673C2